MSMGKPIYGYEGKQLRISLSNRKAAVENIDPQVLRKYLGGAGYGARILYDELKKGIDPLSKANKLAWIPTGMIISNEKWF